MTDIIERLRAHYPFAGLPREAADEIERLRLGRETMGNLWAREKEARHAAEAEVDQQRKQWEDIWRRNVDLLAEIELLRAEVAALRANAPFDAVEDYQQFRRDNPDFVTVDEMTAVLRGVPPARDPKDEPWTVP